MLTTYELKMPGAVYSGEDALGRIPGILAANEVKRLAVFTDRGIEGAGLLELPMAGVREAGVEAVILDAAMIRKLPRKIAAATGVDALSHAIECFTSRKANPFSDIFALQALDMILNSLERACDDPEAMDAKNTMLLASFYAGVAITASGTTAVHALSYPLGGKYHIAHGVSNAILLAPVMRSCRPLLARAYDRCLKGDAGTEAEKSAAVIRRLEEIVRHLDIPASLTEFGVPKEDLEDLVASGMEVTRLLVNNMREVTPEDARKIYQEVL